MDDKKIEMLIQHGEDTKVDYKRTIAINSKSDRKGRAELVRDLIAIANAHEETTGYLLIGVNEQAAGTSDQLVDCQGLDLDDGLMHQIIDEFVDVPITFTFRYQEYKGVMIGIIEIPFSDNRFHVVKKDYTSSDNTQLLRTGESWIRRGARKTPLTGYDMVRLKESIITKATTIPQPLLSVSWGGENCTGADIKISLADSLVSYNIQSSMNFAGFSGEETIDYPNYTISLAFYIENKGTTAADDIHITIQLPDSCLNYRHKIGTFDYIFSGGRPPTTDISAEPESRDIVIFRRKLNHDLGFETDTALVVFPSAGIYDFPWTARAGNMIKPTKGSLKIMVE